MLVLCSTTSNAFALSIAHVTVNTALTETVSWEPTKQPVRKRIQNLSGGSVIGCLRRVLCRMG